MELVIIYTFISTLFYGDIVIGKHTCFCSTVGKPIARMFTKVTVSMFTKTSVFTYYNITIKQSANK